MPLERRLVRPSLLRPLSAGELKWLQAPDTPPRARETPEILLRWCDVCGEWMREGSAAAGACVDCGTPRAP